MLIQIILISVLLLSITIVGLGIRLFFSKENQVKLTGCQQKENSVKHLTCSCEDNYCINN
jgi:hypothetical protein